MSRDHLVNAVAAFLRRKGLGDTGLKELSDIAKANPISGAKDYRGMLVAAMKIRRACGADVAPPEHTRRCRVIADLNAKLEAGE